VTRLSIQLDIPDEVVDPALTDPEDLAHDIIGIYDDWGSHNDALPVTIVSAEWET
jgi:hypothetical protein